MDLIFIRHAQPEWVKDERSVLDPKLTGLGRAQAERLTERDFRAVDELWVSPTRRTRETAEPLAQHLGLKPNILPWLEEVRLPPAWDGSPAATISTAFAQAKKRDLAEWWNGHEGGEDACSFIDRVTTGLDGALGKRGVRDGPAVPDARVFEIDDHERRIVIVGHGGTNAVAIGHLLGLAPVAWAWERFVLAHASVTRLRSTSLVGGRVFGLHEHSDVRHLARGQISR